MYLSPTSRCRSTDLEPPFQQGTLTVLNRQTSFGTFGGGDAASCNILAHTCCTSGASNCDKSTGDGSGSPGGGAGKSVA